MANDWIRPDVAFDQSGGGSSWNNVGNAIDASAATFSNGVCPVGQPVADLQTWFGVGATGSGDAEEKLLSKAWLKMSFTCVCAPAGGTWTFEVYYSGGWHALAGGSGAAVAVDGEYDIAGDSQLCKGLRLRISGSCNWPPALCGPFDLTPFCYDLKGYEVSAASGVPPQMFGQSVLE